MLNARGVFVALAQSLHPQAARHACVIVLAGAFSVWDSDPGFADRAVELCKRLIGDGKLFGELVERARAYA